MLTKSILDWIIWVIEVVSQSLYNGDKTRAYNALKENGILEWYIENYDVTHSLGREYLLEEIREIIAKGGVSKC